VVRRLALAAPLVAAAASAWACPVCFGGEETTLRAYWWSTLMLSLLPFGVIGTIGGVGWVLLRRRPETESAS
jgi:hypothetical protein